jgi:molecular chaperone DnaK
VPQVEVTFDIDANGIVNVSAKDRATGKEQKIRIEASSGLSEDEIQKMVKDAEQHADEDRKRKDLIDARNQLDSLIYSTDKAFNEHKDKLSPEDVGQLTDGLEAARKATASEDVEELKKAANDLQQVSHKLAEIMYKQAQQEGGDAGAAGAQPGAHEQPSAEGAQGDVIDAEYEEEGKS